MTCGRDHRGRAHLDDVDGLLPPFVVRRAEFDMVTFSNFRAAPQVRLVHEHVGAAAVGLDEAVFFVEPLADAPHSM